MNNNKRGKNKSLPPIWNVKKKGKGDPGKYCRRITGRPIFARTSFCGVVSSFLDVGEMDRTGKRGGDAVSEEQQSSKIVSPQDDHGA